MNRTRLFDEFPGVTTKAWKQQIQADLQGADYTKNLVWKSLEGIEVKPFYNAEDLVDGIPVHPPGNADWNIGEPIYAENARAANVIALDALSRGAESLVFTIPGENIGLGELLHGIASGTPVFLDMGFISPGYIQSLQELGWQKSIHLNMDPIGHLARYGNWPGRGAKDLALLPAIRDSLPERSDGSLLAVDASLYQQAGASVIQQLAYALAHANEYLHTFESTNCGRHRGWKLTFKLAIGGDYFFEIAKIRALRLMWRSLAMEYDRDPDCMILARPSRRNKTLYDFNTNLLRSSLECMSAVIGGADTVCNLPYDAVYHKDNEFARRIARNQLLILKNEGHLGLPGNAPDGSYYIENLTLQLAEKGLTLFKELESGGGFLKLLKEQKIQKKIREIAGKEQALFDRGKIILTGTNRFVNPSDAMKAELELYPFLKKQSRITHIEPILEKRLSENIEQNRLKDE